MVARVQGLKLSWRSLCRRPLRPNRRASELEIRLAWMKEQGEGDINGSLGRMVFEVVTSY